MPSKQSLSTEEVLNSVSQLLSQVIHCDSIKLHIKEILEHIFYRPRYVLPVKYLLVL